MEEKRGDTRKSEVIQCLDRKSWKTFIERVRKIIDWSNHF